MKHLTTLLLTLLVSGGLWAEDMLEPTLRNFMYLDVAWIVIAFNSMSSLGHFLSIVIPGIIFIWYLYIESNVDWSRKFEKLLLVVYGILLFILAFYIPLTYPRPDLGFESFHWMLTFKFYTAYTMIGFVYAITGFLITFLLRVIYVLSMRALKTLYSIANSDE
tara:strand:- start:1007 stop:1495 length:489 start_codon:yes stop_codon:yes gene_type:complete